MKRPEQSDPMLQSMDASVTLSKYDEYEYPVHHAAALMSVGTWMQVLPASVPSLYSDDMMAHVSRKAHGQRPNSQALVHNYVCTYVSSSCCGCCYGLTIY
jgi:hypothetical protein